MKKTKTIKEWAMDHREISQIVEWLLDAGWIDNEKVADLIASELLENPYGKEKCEHDFRIFKDWRNKCGEICNKCGEVRSLNKN
jgi:hypothetical protein